MNTCCDLCGRVFEDGETVVKFEGFLYCDLPCVAEAIETKVVIFHQDDEEE